MLGSEPTTAACHAHHHRKVEPPSVRVAVRCGIEKDLRAGAKHEIRVLKLGHGSHAPQRHADGHADDEVFTDRRIEDSIAELFGHPARHAPHAAERAHVFTEDHDRVVTSQFEAQCLANRMCVLERTSHRDAPGESGPLERRAESASQQR